MKTILQKQKNSISLWIVLIILGMAFSAKAQTYTTIANGAWSSASTWQGGTIPNAANIPATAIINIRHMVTYSGVNITNNGTINIKSQTGLAPRLIVASGVSLTNNTGGKIYLYNAEYRQYRFIGGGESGVVQTGSFYNKGGYVNVENSFVEIADDWSNTNFGSRYVKNSSITVGGNYNQTSNATDTLLYTSVSNGWHGTGDFSIAGSNIYFQSVRIQVASLLGIFKLSGCEANGDIDYITLKNHVTNLIGLGSISANNSVTTTGLNLDAYCASSPLSYNSFGKFSGPQTADGSLTDTYFPAKLFASITPGALNFSNSPLLVSGTDLKVGAVYKFEGIAPGIDAIVKIDSFVNGATLDMIDDNSGGLGYKEGFQPQVKAGPSVGESYAVFTMSYKITGTSADYPLATFDITALDIDGNSELKEFDQIIVAPGAVSSFLINTNDIKLTQDIPGSFKGVNVAGIERSGIDTSSKANMFTVSATNLSSVILKLGTVKTNTAQTGRQYGIYFKGFVYPYMATLPVKMESFTATLNNSSTKVNLDWTTTSEENLSHFVVEKSTDGVNFSDAGVVFAAGSSTDKMNYSFPDDIAYSKASIIYYRLRSVDNDKNEKYSEIRIIRLNKQQEQITTILTYPNPVKSELRITVPANWQNRKAVFEIYSANGQVLTRMEKANCSQTETVNVSKLAPAFYIVLVKCNGETARQTIIKQ